MVATRTGTQTSETHSASKTNGKTVKSEPEQAHSSKNDTGHKATDGSASTGDKHKPADHDRGSEENHEHKRQKTEKAEENDNVKGAQSSQHDSSSRILEKGSIYFFFRARVNVEEPHSLDDVARTYLVLQPEKTKGQKDAPSRDCRLLALPKKVLPQTGRERFMAFLLKADASFSELQKEFLTDSEYEVKSPSKDGGDAHKQQHTPAATAFGEGVYALIGTERESHLAYHLTVPAELGKVQRQLGLTKKQGCFIVSTKNPAYPMPGGGKMVGGGPSYPKEMQDSFRSLRWVPLQPEHLQYVNTHLLLVGESKGTEKLFAEGKEGDDGEDRAGREMSTELDELADADLDRMRRLGSTEAEAVFASLRAKDQAKGQPELSETFD